MNIFEWAVTVTENSEWKMSRFHEFSKNATQKEFLSSQEDFYYAVHMFPRLLCLVAGNIETSEHRLKIIEWLKYLSNFKSIQSLCCRFNYSIYIYVKIKNIKKMLNFLIQH